MSLEQQALIIHSAWNLSILALRLHAKVIYSSNTGATASCSCCRGVWNSENCSLAILAALGDPRTKEVVAGFIRAERMLL
jgi:hypothetical protein